jgi:hypothetical protein
MEIWAAGLRLMHTNDSGVVWYLVTNLEARRLNWTNRNLVRADRRRKRKITPSADRPLRRHDEKTHSPQANVDQEYLRERILNALYL